MSAGSRERSTRPWFERYRDLRRRVRRLESIYEDRERHAAVVATGRVFKLAYATARAYQQIEQEFSALPPDDGG